MARLAGAARRDGRRHADRWQAQLPEPFNFLSSVLEEVIDDVLLTAHINEQLAKAADTKAIPDPDEAAELGPPGNRVLPPALVGMDADTLLAPIAEGVYAVALKSGGLFLWDAGGGSEPQAIGEAAEGLVPCRLTVTPLPPSTAPPARRRVMLLAATPAPPVEEGADPTPCGEEDAQLLVLDLAPPSVKNLEALQAGWDVAKVAELRLAAQAPAASATYRATAALPRACSTLAASPSTICRSSFRCRAPRRRRRAPNRALLKAARRPRSRRHQRSSHHNTRASQSSS